MHGDDTVGKRHGFDLVVGDIDRRGFQLAVQLLDFSAHLLAQAGVEVGERLVEKESLGLAHNGAAHGNALTLAAGKRFRATFQQRLKAEFGGGRLDGARDFLFRRFAQPHAVAHIVGNAHMRIERIGLEHHRNVAVLGCQFIDALAADLHLPGRDVFKACNHAQQSGFSAAGRADQHDEFAIFDLKIDTMQNSMFAIALADRLNIDGSHREKSFQPLTAPAVRPCTRYR